MIWYAADVKSATSSFGPQFMVLRKLWTILTFLPIKMKLQYKLRAVHWSNRTSIASPLIWVHPGYWWFCQKMTFGFNFSGRRCDSNEKLRFVQTDWPGAITDFHVYRWQIFYHVLCSKYLPNYVHVVADKAYSPAATECNYHFFDSLQLTLTKKE
jgi:hypothetical protein